MMSGKLTNLKNYECFGRAEKADAETDAMNDFLYLFTYLFTIALNAVDLNKNRDILPGPCPDKNAIAAANWDFYRMECIVEYFKCKHDFDVERILTLFGLSPTALTGIDHMTITPGGPCDNLFTVK